VRRDTWFLAGIIMYCLAVALFTFWPDLSFSSKKIPAQSVQAATTVRFAVEPDSPDPNELLTLVNQQRVQQGLPVVVANEKLASVASTRAADMVLRQYYAHKDLGGKYYYDYFADHGVEVSYSCENLDMLFVADNSQAIRDWLASNKGHRECLLNPNITTAGYAIVPTTRLNHQENETSAYIVVVIHSTSLR
jgi:uncharacterized protein YkwD